MSAQGEESPATGPGRSGGAAAGGAHAVRVVVAPASRRDDDPVIVVTPAGPAQDDPPWDVLVNGERSATRLEALDDTHARLVGAGGRGTRTDVLFGSLSVDVRRGVGMREVVVDGWRFEVEIEPERRAALRERARRGASVAGHGGPVEIRAIIPGRVVAVTVAAGDAVTAGQQVLVVEAMKMQNELRAPRDGAVARIGVAVGDTIDVGDLLVVIQ